jgi:hypothetical protein
MLLVGALAFGAADARAAEISLCAKQDAKTESTGKGDKDHDGLSDCREKRITHTNAKNADSDGDEVMDGTEIHNGTNPTDADSDDDGLDDGDEIAAGCNPNEPDSDDDGIEDGEDSDPSGDLEAKIVGPLDQVNCPEGSDNGSLKVLGITIALTSDTHFDHVASCSQLLTEMGVEVRVTGTLETGFIATAVSVEDGDDDGTPDDLEDENDLEEDD